MKKNSNERGRRNRELPEEKGKLAWRRDEKKAEPRRSLLGSLNETHYACENIENFWIPGRKKKEIFLYESES